MANLHFFAVSDRGVSTANNDAFCAEKIGNYHVFGVAEGRPDLSGSGSASTIAISSLRESVQSHKKSPSAILEGAVHQSETRIHMHAVKSPENIGDSTHLSACIIDDALNSTILDTGEGNVYLISPDSIHIPRDYPSSGQPEGLGDLSQNPGGEKNLMDMISHTLGEPHILSRSDFVTVNLRDLFLLISSGGLHDFVRKERIADIVIQNEENVEASCEHLLQEALSAGSEQTITLVLVHGHVH